MQKTTFKISKMDCPSEEQMIRMKLADLTNINLLDFDIANRQLTVFHTDNHDQIFQRLDNLKFDTSLIDSVLTDNYSTSTDNTQRERKLLWQVLAINFFFLHLKLRQVLYQTQCISTTSPNCKPLAVIVKRHQKRKQIVKNYDRITLHTC
jgi:cation transport ATPase